jgi:hypothetical protein
VGRIRQKPRVWCVDRQDGNRLAYVGIVTASSKEEAFRRACERFAVDAEHERELVVREMLKTGAGQLERGANRAGGRQGEP